MLFKYFSVIVSVVISLIQDTVIFCLDLSSFLTTASPALLTQAIVLQKFHCAAPAENLHEFLLFSEWHTSCLYVILPLRAVFSSSGDFTFPSATDHSHVLKHYFPLVYYMAYWSLKSQLKVIMYPLIMTDLL